MGYEDIGSYHLKVEHSFLASGDELPLASDDWTLDAGHEYVQEFAGNIIWRHADADEPVRAASPDDQMVVGRFKGLVLRATRAINDGQDLRDHCDAHSQLALDYAQAFYRTDGQPRARSWKADAVSETDLLIIDEVALHPKHRGRAVGLRTLRRLIDLFGAGCGLVATVPYPLQHLDSRSETPAFDLHPEPDLARGQAKLVSYLAPLGFWRVAGSRFYAASLTHVMLSEKDLRSRKRSAIVVDRTWQEPSAISPS